MRKSHHQANELIQTLKFNTVGKNKQSRYQIAEGKKERDY